GPVLTKPPAPAGFEPQPPPIPAQAAPPPIEQIVTQQPVMQQPVMQQPVMQDQGLLPGRMPGARVDWASVPRVNLLPQEITDKRRFRHIQRVLLGVIGLVLLLCGLLTTWEQSRVTQARDELELIQNEAVDLERQQAKFAEVPKVSAQLDAARLAREQALGGDVLWFRFLTDLAVNTPPGTVLSSVTIEMSGSATPTRPATGDPFAPPGLGSVKVVGQAGEFTDVASWLDSVGKVNGLSGTLLESAARGGDTSADPGIQISYSGAAVVTPAALSHRYDRKAG
ncbi:MAG: hypothetical protein QG622_2314, partial [Actinomycetota bacterium]|nr:hypothetical protein [Actinomycetota bacterium]